MVHKDYDRMKNQPFPLCYECSIDVSFLPDGQQDFSEVVSMWEGDFHFIMNLIPINNEELWDELILNDEGMWDGMALHHYVDRPWEEQEDEPWEIDKLELTLKQLQYVQKLLHNMEPTPDYHDIPLLSNICDDICEIVKKAANGHGKAFITYYQL